MKENSFSYEKLIDCGKGLLFGHTEREKIVSCLGIARGRWDSQGWRTLEAVAVGVAVGAGADAGRPHTPGSWRSSQPLRWRLSKR